MLQFKTKPKKYKCGHEGKPVLFCDDIFCITKYVDWMNTAGFEGDRSKCWECWCRGN